MSRRNQATQNLIDFFLDITANPENHGSGLYTHEYIMNNVMGLNCVDFIEQETGLTSGRDLHNFYRSSMRSAIKILQKDHSIFVRAWESHSRADLLTERGYFALKDYLKMKAASIHCNKALRQLSCHVDPLKESIAQQSNRTRAGREINQNKQRLDQFMSIAMNTLSVSARYIDQMAREQLETHAVANPYSPGTPGGIDIAA